MKELFKVIGSSLLKWASSPLALAVALPHTVAVLAPKDSILEQGAVFAWDKVVDGIAEFSPLTGLFIAYGATVLSPKGSLLEAVATDKVTDLSTQFLLNGLKPDFVPTIVAKTAPVFI